MSIPIVIGVTGHRDLRKQDLAQLQATVTEELKKIKNRHPDSELIMLNSIASGADTLCANAAIELGIKLICPLPMPVEDYRTDFEGDDAAEFDALLKAADDVFVAPAAEPEPAQESRDFYYRQAGIYVASNSHLLLALWDGKPGTLNGCGTAETVDFMLNGCPNLTPYHFKAHNDGAVLHIHTPRAGSIEDDTISVSLLELEPGSLQANLRMTNTFNADEKNCKASAPPADLLLNQQELSRLGKGAKKLHEQYQTADQLALLFQKKYLHAIQLFSVFGILLVLSFLFYDEIESDLFLLCYGAVMLIYFILYCRVQKGKSHEKYLQYRMLSETLRAQFYLKATGISDNIGNAFTWTQKQESAWVKEAIDALLLGSAEPEKVSVETIKEAWIDGQLRYHQNAFHRDSKKHRIHERTAKWMLIISILLFIAVFVLEFFMKHTMTAGWDGMVFPAFFMHHPEQIFTLRSLMKILLGGVSAVTVFLSSYYGKLSFDRTSQDHEKMMKLYMSAKEQFENGTADKKQLFRELAREEVIENGNWFSYCRENSPTFDV